MSSSGRCCAAQVLRRTVGWPGLATKAGSYSGVETLESAFDFEAQCSSRVMRACNRAWHKWRNLIEMAIKLTNNTERLFGFRMLAHTNKLVSTPHQFYSLAHLYSNSHQL